MINEVITPVSYLCKYAILDEMLNDVISSNQIVNLFFDTKNILSSLHKVEEQQKLIQAYVSNSDKFIIARTIILTANHWMRYFKRKNIGCNIFFFDERGSSVYHDSISKRYKEKRKTSKQRIASELLLGDDFYDKYYKVYDDNIAVVSGLFSRLNNLFYIKLKDLESDFIPKLLINEFFSSNGETDKRYTNIIIGNDKDFGQMLYEPNVFQIVKLATEKRFELRTSWNVLEKFVKTPFTEDCVLRNPKFIPLMLAIAGDEADSIFGISKVANKTIYKYLNRLYKDKIIDDNDYDVELFYNKIENYKKINANYLNDLTTHKLISEKDRMIDNYKLTSFDKVLEWLKNDSKKKIIAQLDKVSSNDEQRNTLLSKLCLNRKSFDFLI